MPRIKKKAKITSYHTPSLRSNPILPFPHFFTFFLRVPCLPLMTCEHHSLNNLSHTGIAHMSGCMYPTLRLLSKEEEGADSEVRSQRTLRCPTCHPVLRGANINKEIRTEIKASKSKPRGDRLIIPCTCKAFLFSEFLFPI